MPISDLGMPLEDHLFAVFNTPEAADHAAQDLAKLDVPVHRLTGPEAVSALMGPETGTNDVLAMVRRVLRGFSEEAHEADRYARHLEHGRVVLAMPAENRAVAVLLTNLLTRDGGYDVTFYDNLTYEHLTPATFGPESPAPSEPASSQP